MSSWLGREKCIVKVILLKMNDESEINGDFNYEAC